MFPGNYGWYSDTIGNAASCICFLQMTSQTICHYLLEDTNLTLSPCVVDSMSVHSFLHEFFNGYTIILLRNEKEKKNPQK